MDRNTATGLILILFIMFAWAYFTMPSEEELQQRQAEQAREDSVAAAQADTQDTTRQDEEADPDDEEAQRATPSEREEEAQEAPSGGVFGAASVSDTSEVVVDTDLYIANFTNVGAGPGSFFLKEHFTWEGDPVQLIADSGRSAYSMGFLTSENYNIETNNLIFEQITDADTLRLEEGETEELQYALNLEDGGRILYTYTLQGGSYEVDLDITFEEMGDHIIGNTVDFGWTSRIDFTERDATQEATQTGAYVYAGGEMEKLLMEEEGEDEQNINGNIEWVSTRTKFFTQIIKPETPTDGAYLTGELSGSVDDPSSLHHYQSYIRSELSDQVVSYDLYVGPLSYDTLKDFDEHAFDMLEIGYAMFRWFSDPLIRLAVIPYFDFLGGVMNYGFAIILFAVFVKMVLYPLTKKSYRSMAAMKELQPQMKEIQEKYKDKPQKQQEATLKLYKKAKVNPLGGCLPNLLQLPILITLWYYFQNSILIRQQSFLWADDLSAPDYILNLPISIPFIGDQLAGFVLLMTGAMFLQSKVTGGMGEMSGGAAAGGQMKMLKYIFPIMLLFIFNNFAAGLSLYYLVYNLVSIGQQLVINRQLDKEKLEKQAEEATG